MTIHTRTYSPADIHVMVTAGDGTMRIADFETVDVDMAEDKFTHRSSATGHVSRTFHPNRLGTISITVAMTSTVNNYMYDVYEGIRKGRRRGVFATVSVADKLGTSLHKIMEASLQRVPNKNYSGEVADVTWVFEGLLEDHIVGGSKYTTEDTVPEPPDAIDDDTD